MTLLSSFGKVTLTCMGLKPTNASAYDPERIIRPNDSQLSLIENISKDYDFTCFGDTDHRKPEIHLFALNHRMVQTLELAGKHNYFLEMDHSKNDMFEKDTPGYMFFENFLDCKSDFVKGTLSQEHLSEEMRYNILKTNVKFKGIDSRYDDDDLFSNLNTKEICALLYCVCVLQLQKAAFGHMDPYAPLLKVINGILGLAVNAQNIIDALTDDLKAIDNIYKFSGGEHNGAMLYGSGHFFHSNPKNIGNTLKRLGHKVCVIQVHKDEESLNEHANKYGEETCHDVDMVIFPSDHNPAGIYT